MASRRYRQYVLSPRVLQLLAYTRLKEDSGLLPASCWCERRIVAVNQADVRAGITESCGHPACRAPTGSPEI